MPDELKNLSDQRTIIVEKMRDILGKCRSENRVWNSDEATNYANLEKALQENRDSSEKQQAFDKASVDLEDSMREADALPKPEVRNGRSFASEKRGEDDVPSSEEKAEAFRLWALSNLPDYSPTEKESQLMNRCGFRNTKHIQLRHSSRARTEHRGMTALQSTTTAGGYLTPDDLMASIETAVKEFGGMIGAGTMIVSSTGRPLPIPTMDDTGNVGALAAEEAAITETNPTVGQVVLDGWKYTSKIIKVSREFLQDTSINVASYLGARLGERIARIVNTDITTGNGTSKPRGIADAAGTGVDLTAVQNPTFSELVTLMHSVDPAWRKSPKCAFMMADAIWANVKRIVDSQGRPLYLPSMREREPGTILGFPVIINQDVSAVATVGAKVIIFGDMGQYIIRHSDQLELVQLNELYAANGQIGFVAFDRWDGDLLHASATLPPVRAAIN